MRRLSVLSSFSLFCALLAVQPAIAQRYAITDLGTLPGDVASYGRGIDRWGQVTGYSYTGMGNVVHAFIYSEGVMLDLGTLPGGNASAGYAISGPKRDIKVTGYATTPNGSNHAFLYTEGIMQDLGTLPGGRYSLGFAVNSSGQVTGESNFGTDYHSFQAFLYSDGQMMDLGTLPGDDYNVGYSIGYAINSRGEVAGDSSGRAFLYSNGIMSSLGTLDGGRYSGAYAMNNHGEVTGAADAADGNLHAFLYKNRKMQDLGTVPGKTSSIGLGINGAGEVVGYAYSGPNSDFRAFLYSKHTMEDLNNLIPNDSGWVLLYAYSINNRGQITGYGTVNGATHAYLLTPVSSTCSGHGDDDAECDVKDLED